MLVARKASCCVADTFSTGSKVIWPRSSLKITKMSKNALFAKSSRSQWVKILGVTLDKGVSYKEHISDQLKKAYAKASALRRIRLFLSQDAVIKLYKAFILPHL